MGNALFVVGEKANILANAGLAGGVTELTGAVVDPDHPLSNLYEGRTSQPTKWTVAASGTAALVSVDGNIVVNGNLNAWVGGLPTSWNVLTTGTGAVTPELTTVISGTSAKLVTGTGTAVIYQDINVKSGQPYHIEAQLYGSGGAGAAEVVVHNLHTGKRWNGTAWATTGVALTKSTSGFGNLTEDFTIEDFPTTGRDTCTLRISVQCTTASSTVYADEVYCWPSVDFLSVHGHTFTGGVGVQLHSDTVANFGSATLRGSLAAVSQQYSPTFFIQIGSVISARFWRLQLTGYVLGMPLPQIGEMVLGIAYVGPRCINLPLEMSQQFADTTNDMFNGDQHTFSLSTWEQRSYNLGLTYISGAQEVAFRNEILSRTRGRALAFVCVPDLDLPDVVLGRIDRTWTVTRVSGDVWIDNTLQLTELPFFLPSDLVLDTEVVEESCWQMGIAGRSEMGVTTFFCG